MPSHRQTIYKLNKKIDRIKIELHEARLINEFIKQQVHDNDAYSQKLLTLVHGLMKLNDKQGIQIADLIKQIQIEREHPLHVLTLPDGETVIPPIDWNPKCSKTKLPNLHKLPLNKKAE